MKQYRLGSKASIYTVFVVSMMFGGCDELHIKSHPEILGKCLSAIKMQEGTTQSDKVLTLIKGEILEIYQGDLFSFFPHLQDGDSILVREIWVLNERNNWRTIYWCKMSNKCDWEVFDAISFSNQISF